jgi:hypothetical protein
MMRITHLRRHDGALPFAGKSRDMPGSMERVVRSEADFTQAISTDAAVVGAIPVAKPEGAVNAAAFLATMKAESARCLPDRIILSVVGQRRAFIAVAPLHIKIETIPACTAISA